MGNLAGRKCFELKEALCLGILLTTISWYYFIQLKISLSYYLILLIINSFLCLWNMVDINGKPYSIKMFVNIFIYFFFILANAIQYANNSLTLTFHIIFKEQDYIQFQYIVLILLLLVNGFYSLTLPSSINYTKTHYNLSVKKMLIVSTTVTFIILSYYKFNPYLLFARGITEDIMRENGIVRGHSNTSQSFSLFFNNFIRPIPWSCFIISLLYKTRRKIQILLFVFTFLTVCPTGIPRNAAAMFWLPILILVGRKRMIGLRFLYLMFLGLFIAFPLLGNFRRFSGKIRLNFGLDYLDSMNFDASQIFMAVMNKNVITMGNQLLGVIFFWVPRSIWPNKPVGSGFFLVTNSGGGFPNVSMPFFAEGFINFGYIGLLIAAIGIGICAKKLDTRYWQSISTPSLYQGLYFIALGATIFIMRGDLMSSFAYTFGICCSFIFSAKIMGIRSKVMVA